MIHSLQNVSFFRKLAKHILGNASLSSFSNFRIDAIVVLISYIFIFSLPNIFGFSSRAQPDLFALWQFISLAVLFTLGIVIALLRKTLSAQLLPVYMLLLTSNVLTLLSTPDTLSTSSLFSSFIPLLMTLSFYIFCGNSKLSPIQFNKLCRFFVTFVIFASIYNLIINAGSIVNFASITDPYQYSLQSFFENKNAFAFLLSVGITLLIYLKSAKAINNLSFILSLLLLSANLLMTLSRGGILFAVVAAFAYYVLYGNIRKIFAYIIFVTGIVLFTLTYLGGGFIENNIIRSQAGSTYRDSVQEDGMNFYHSHNTLYGSGDLIRPYLDYKYELTSLHSTYLDILVTGGIFKAVTYALIGIMLLYRVNRIRKVHRNVGNLLMTLLITYLLYSTLETATPFLLSATSAAISVFIFIAPIYIYNDLVDTGHRKKSLHAIS